METRKTKLALTASALAFALMLAGCGGGGSTSSAVTPSGGGGGNNNPPPAEDPPPAPKVVDAEGSVMLRGDEARALRKALPAGELTALFPITFTVPAGEMAYQGGLWFECDSAYPCEITVRRGLGSGVGATWTSREREDSSMASVTAKLPKRFGPFPEMNDIAAAPVSIVTNDETTVGGLGLDGMGPMSLDDVTLTSNLNPNASDHVIRAGFNSAEGTFDRAGSGGSTMTYKADKTTENVQYLTISDPWTHKAMFRDWGDTDEVKDEETSDGGFETATVLYSDMEAPTSKPFNAKLKDEFAHGYVQKWFTLNASGAVEIQQAEAPSLAWIVPQQNISITVEGSQAAQTRINVGAVEAAARLTANAYRGTYFGAPGSFACIGTTNCVLERSMTGSANFGVPDTDMTAGGLQSQGTWEFTPDPGAMVMVPDQDWMVFGSWVTAPDDPGGTHRFGGFYDGMDAYNYGDATTAGLKGSAKYAGVASGFYSIDREEDKTADGYEHSSDEAGLFTASARLTVNFDVAGTANDHMLSGEIFDFKNVNGRYLGYDTQADPNHPDGGGDNDWTLKLDAARISSTGGLQDGSGSVSGSADGHKWHTDGGNSNWTAQLYGPHGTTAAPVAPSSVGGWFQAVTTTQAIHIGGAFGAHKTE